MTSLIFKNIFCFISLLTFCTTSCSEGLNNNLIDFYSNKFINKPYVLNPLGEGKLGRYDQSPRIRFDAFDCMTYVETVIALTIKTKHEKLIKVMDKIRYRNGSVKFENRNHFTELDWNTNNEKQGIIKDLTKQITGVNLKPVYITVYSTINKGKWFEVLTLKSIKLFNGSETLKKERLQELHSYGRKLKPQTIKLTYVPITKILADNSILNNIPDGAIIEIVRPNWDLTEKIGTTLNISHLGFAIRKNNILYFRNASSVYHKVTEEPMLTYLKKTQSIKSIKGIKILKLS